MVGRTDISRCCCNGVIVPPPTCCGDNGTPDSLSVTMADWSTMVLPVTGYPGLVDSLSWDMSPLNGTHTFLPYFSSSGSCIWYAEINITVTYIGGFLNGSTATGPITLLIVDSITSTTERRVSIQFITPSWGPLARGMFSCIGNFIYNFDLYAFKNFDYDVGCCEYFDEDIPLSFFRLYNGTCIIDNLSYTDVPMSPTFSVTSHCDDSSMSSSASRSESSTSSSFSSSSQSSSSFSASSNSSSSSTSSSSSSSSSTSSSSLSSSSSTSSSSSSSSSSLNAPCGTCDYEWQIGAFWLKLSDACVDGCGCAEPGYGGSYEGEIVTVACIM